MMNTQKLLIDEAFLPAAKNLISKAQKNIWITTFKAEITTVKRGAKLYNFFEILFEKAAAGININFMINQINNRGTIPSTNFCAIMDLQKHGIKVRQPRLSRVYHSKVILVDNAEAIIGSHNLSVKSCHNNFECSIYNNDTFIVEALRDHLERLWERSRLI